MAGCQRRGGAATIQRLDAPEGGEQRFDLVRTTAVEAESLVGFCEPPAFGSFLLGDEHITLLRMIKLGLIARLQIGRLLLLLLGAAEDEQAAFLDLLGHRVEQV